MSLVRSIGWNYLGYSLEFFAALLLTSYLVRRIPVNDYGIFLLAQSVAALLYVLEFGTGSMLVPLYISALSKRGISDVRRLAGTVFLTLLFLGAIGATVLSLVALFIPRLIGMTSGSTALAIRVLVLVSLGVWLSLPQVALEQVCQAFELFDRLSQVQIAVVLFRVALTVAVLSSGKGVVALAVIQIAVSFVRLVTLWFVVYAALGKRSPTLRFDIRLLRETMSVGKWAFCDDISRRIGMSVEPTILASVGPFGQVAVFGVGGRLPAHLYQFAARGLSVLVPTLSQHHAQARVTQLQTTFTNAYRVCLTGFVPLAIFASICSSALIKIWAGEAYAEAGPVLGLLLISTIAIVLMLPSDMVLYSHHRIRQAARFSVLETVGKVVLVLMLAGRFGAVGVAAGVTFWHWCIYLFFYLPAACRVARMHGWHFWRAALLGPHQHLFGQKGNLPLAVTFAFCVAALGTGIRFLSATPMFFGCILFSLLYACIWALCIALPMWRGTRIGAVAG